MLRPPNTAKSASVSALREAVEVRLKMKPKLELEQEPEPEPELEPEQELELEPGPGHLEPRSSLEISGRRAVDCCLWNLAEWSLDCCYDC
mmetsp:Transcript_21641/g.33873  ORF Transcript_21641/g.33873 Transcript_21641/m.33873 type:complete len:90 (-) Transcript_21641:1225-1494(-)